jgi:hypothetical protein
MLHELLKSVHVKIDAQRSRASMLARLRKRYEDFWLTALVAVSLAAIFLRFLSFEPRDSSKNCAESEEFL